MLTSLDFSAVSTDNSSEFNKNILSEDQSLFSGF
jgi:hypothetical protein